MDVVLVNHLQVAGVPAYLVVPHEEAQVLGATAVALSQPSPSFAIHDWQKGDRNTSMPPLYIGSASSTMHHIMTLLPRYATLERYFLGLDDDFKVVPIGTRGTVITSSLLASKCSPVRATTKGTHDTSTFKLTLMNIFSPKGCCNSIPSTR